MRWVRSLLRDNSRMTPATVRMLTPRRLLMASVVVAAVTITLKTLAWYVTGSVGLLSDAMESFVNLASALFAVLMVTIAERPADDDHPFGHTKAEYFSSGVEGTLILVAIAASTLLWALSQIETLERPDKFSRVEPLYRLLEMPSKQTWLESVHLRPASEILDALDLHYRYHWAVVDARLQLHLPPAGLNPDVVQQRHYALNWLTGYMDQPWDAVTTDT